MCKIVAGTSEGCQIRREQITSVEKPFENIGLIATSTFKK